MHLFQKLLISVVTVALVVGMSSANAKKPLDVDCDLLAATNDAVNLFLDSMTNIQFDNLGDYFSSLILDDDIFNDISSLILFFSGGAIDFESASQLISTNGKCGLIPQLRGNIAD